MKKILNTVIIILVGTVLLASCKQKMNKEESLPIETSEKRINELQVIGSHNSYKEAIDSTLFQYLLAKDTTKSMLGLQYAHVPILDQLTMGLRNLEIDVYVDKDGGRYANPAGIDLGSSELEYDLEEKMKQPGFKMLHIPDIDFRTQYYLLEDCLKDLKRWSEANPNHEVVFITLEPKDGDTNKFGTTPEPFTPEAFNELDQEILKHLGKENIISPSDVKGNYATLEEAVLHNNWPTLEEGAGKFLFILDTQDEKREKYANRDFSYSSKMIFINAEQGNPEAATMIINDPEDKRISEFVKKGYIIRTRADANTQEARNNDYSRFNTAKASGAQIITTDYYMPSKLFNSTYEVKFEDGSYVRENPVR
ncbi:Phosphoinositide phospholipase C, Ca2+-dependent [Mesonia phycicola]|uniref:Phosphoinositide phospholipase C, Ca2+-dependent n=1 Tax=Mesonia phycicola TaxID=579105 RepID=A0A1M6F9R3_9FLAO|nr:phosphatidylinositol-specific phospholipase C1-like protein [Mesonia phycicola]SHI94484.1 Phosphoinositide phospholipase C, Ca2+-dependent [Mesonia phycicola]